MADSSAADVVAEPADWASLMSRPAVIHAGIVSGMPKTPRKSDTCPVMASLPISPIWPEMVVSFDSVAAAVEAVAAESGFVTVTFPAVPSGTAGSALRSPKSSNSTFSNPGPIGRWKNSLKYESHAPAARAPTLP